MAPEAKRLAFVSTILTYPWGGADALWTRAARHAATGGDRVLLGISEQVSAHPSVAVLLASGARLCIRRTHEQTLGRRHALERAWRNLRHPRENLLRNLKAFRPDAVFLCQGGTFDFLVELQLMDFLDSARIPYFLICQANDGLPFSGEDPRQMARAVMGKARQIFFVSEHNRHAAERQLSMPLVDAAVVQEPLASPEAAPPWPEGTEVRFAVVARLHATDKGLDVLLPALNEALSNEAGWHLDIYGSGPSEKYLRDLSAMLGLTDRVSFLGRTDDITAVWRTHHMLLLPSRIEGCSLAMLEALHHGRPVLAACAGGCTEWISPGRSGYLCDAPEEKSLARTLAQAWSERATWREMGRVARAETRARWDPCPERNLFAFLAQ